MKIYSVGKTLSCFTTALLLISCGGDEIRSSGYVDNPVTVDGDIVLDYEEMSDVMRVDLLEGVDNPHKDKTRVYTNNFTYNKYELDEDGKPITNKPLWKGPDLPRGAVYQDNETIIIDTNAWSKVLVHESQNGGDPYSEPYSKGHYTFYIDLDNGAKEAVRRNISLTVTGVEDKVVKVEFEAEAPIEVGAGLSVQVIANTYAADYPNALEPDDRPEPTYPDAVFTTSSSDVSITEGGLLTAGDQVGASFMLTASSHDGEVSAEINGVIVAPKPSGFEMRLEGSTEAITELDMHPGNAQLKAVIIPEGLEGYPITWTSSNPEVISVDENGLIYARWYNIDASSADDNEVKITASANIGVDGIPNELVTTVSIVPDKSNWAHTSDHAFESGTLEPHWAGEDKDGPLNAVVSTEAKKDGEFGLTMSRGFLWTTTKFDLKPIDRNTLYKVSFDVRRINDGKNGGGVLRLHSRDPEPKSINPNNGVGPEGKGNTSPWYWLGDKEWTHKEYYFNGWRIIDELNPEDLRIMFESRDGSPDVYIDNVRFEEIN